MEIIGKIILALPEVSGTSKAGNPWKKREYVLETIETYPKKVMFDFFGDRADQYPLTVGQEVRLTFDIESREYNGRWYTSIRGLKAEPASSAAAAPAQFGGAPAQYGGAPVPPAVGNQAAPAVDLSQVQPTDDLPF